MTKYNLAKSDPRKLTRIGRDDLYSEFMTPFSSFFDDFFKDNPIFQKKYGANFFEKGSYPKVDIRDTNGAIVIEAAVPGMSKEDISIDIYEGVLTISGEKRSEEYEDGNYLYRELKRSSFRRSWTINDYLDSDNITASFENGMLYLNIPKLKPEAVKDAPRKIEIK